ncbi:MAG: phage holin family protein [Actinomycetota bacterium]|nr:phage holin family protein [Actinomycetota bacterium]
MPTPANGGVGSVIHEVAERASALARLEAELAILELRRKITSLGIGGALVLGAGILGLFAVGFLLATAAAGLAIFLDTWLALLMVAGGLLVLTAVAAAVGISTLKRGVPPIPERAVNEAKLTASVLRGSDRG